MDKDYWGNKRILITGGTGFMGKNLMERLDGLGSQYFIFGSGDFDLTNPDNAERAMKEEDVKYDFIFHLAAFQHAGDWPMHHTGIQFLVNSQIHLNTLEAWRKHQPQAKFVGAGSVCSFPGSASVLSEDDHDNGPLHESVYSYGFTKKLLGAGIRAYKDQYGLRGTMPVFATLYGPHDDFDLETAHVVAALTRKFIGAKETGLPEVEVWGDGTASRELIYVQDQIDGLLMASRHYEGDLINVGSGEETTIRDLAETIKGIVGFDGSIFYNADRFVGVERKVSDIKRAEREFGWTLENRMHILEEGLTKTIDWYRENIL